MLIDLPKIFGRGINEEKEKADLRIVADNSLIEYTLSTEGWRILQESLLAELKRHDSIRIVQDDKIEFERGYCNGLDYLLQVTRSYKRKAIESQKYLDWVAKQKE